MRSARGRCEAVRAGGVETTVPDSRRASSSSVNVKREVGPEVDACRMALCPMGAGRAVSAGGGLDGKWEGGQCELKRTG